MNEVLLRSESAEELLILDVLDAALFGLGDLILFHIEIGYINYSIRRRNFVKKGAGLL